MRQNYQHSSDSKQLSMKLQFDHILVAFRSEFEVTAYFLSQYGPSKRRLHNNNNNNNGNKL